MRFAAAHRQFMTTPPAMDADCAALGAWIRVLSYCTSDGVETDRLVGAKLWKDREWLTRAHVSAAEVEHAVTAGLASWRGDDLVVDGYDEEGERKVKLLRSNGRFGALGGRPRGVQKVAKPPREKPLRGVDQKPMGNPQGFPNKTPVTDPDPDPKRSEQSARRSADRPPAPASAGTQMPLGKTEDPEKIARAAPPPPASPVVMVFPCSGKVPEWSLTKAQIDEWREIFPGLDVAAQCRLALGWAKANKLKRKTAVGMPRFLYTWLSKSNDAPASNGHNGYRGGGYRQAEEVEYPKL